MQLIPKESLKALPTLYATEKQIDPICHIKLFTPDSNWTWYIIEISQSDNDTCYGYVQGLESELGYFSLKELESIRGQFNLAIELDITFKPIPLSQVKKLSNG
ncbi:MAG: DUF2958 domain-containing protein [Campylobacterota bacterium]